MHYIRINAYALAVLLYRWYV